jgi:hypothetical protein
MGMQTLIPCWPEVTADQLGLLRLQYLWVKCTVFLVVEVDWGKDSFFGSALSLDRHLFKLLA